MLISLSDEMLGWQRARSGGNNIVIVINGQAMVRQEEEVSIYTAIASDRSRVAGAGH
jgi:hypothetical protein